MKRKVFFPFVLLLSVLFSFTAFAGLELNNTNFPDAAFRKIVSQFDTNKDGFLIPDEVAEIREIDCKKDPNVKNLTGIEHFTNLESLTVWACPIKTLDLSSNIRLNYLDCCECGLTSLDVSSNEHLVQLWAYGNAFTSLDLSKNYYLSKAVQNGVYNNDKNGGTALSYADDETNAYLVVDKKVKLKIGDKNIEAPAALAPASASSSGDFGMGAIGTPAEGQIYELGETVSITIYPYGSASIGGTTVSGNLEILFNSAVSKLSQSISSGGGGIQVDFVPDKAGTYTINVSMIYKLMGMQVDTSRKTRTFIVADPNAPEPAAADTDSNAEKGSCKKGAAHQFGKWTVTKPATALAAGTRERICSVCGEKETETVAKLTPQLKLGKTSVKIAKTKSVSLKVTFAAGDKISVKSSNKKIAKASYSSGKLKITAQKKAGKADITVTTKSGKNAIVKVTVPKAKTTKLTCKAVKVNKGKKVTLKPVVKPAYSDDKITYKSANKKIAKVSSKGVIKGIKKGTTYVTVKSGKKSVKVKVTVK